MAEAVLYGPAYSTYVRTARLVMEEKGVPYRLEEIDIFSGEQQNESYLRRHPFGKVPAFEHDGFELYETDAVTRYVDLAFDGPSLQPADAKGQGRMTQIIDIVDSYGYGPIVGKIVINRLVMPKLNESPDEQAIAEALPEARKVAGELDRLIGDNPYAAGEHMSLADLHLFPVFDYLAATPEGEEVLRDAGRLQALYTKLAERESAQGTKPSL